MCVRNVYIVIFDLKKKIKVIYNIDRFSKNNLMDDKNLVITLMTLPYASAGIP